MKSITYISIWRLKKISMSLAEMEERDNIYDGHKKNIR